MNANEVSLTVCEHFGARAFTRSGTLLVSAGSWWAEKHGQSSSNTGPISSSAAIEWVLIWYQKEQDYFSMSFETNQGAKTSGAVIALAFLAKAARQLERTSSQAAQPAATIGKSPANCQRSIDWGWKTKSASEGSMRFRWIRIDVSNSISNHGLAFTFGLNSRIQACVSCSGNGKLGADSLSPKRPAFHDLVP